MTTPQKSEVERYLDTPLSKAWNTWKKVWRWLKWPAALAAVIYIGLFIWGAYLHGEKYATDDAIAFINSRKLTLDDVKGTHLPPPPDAANTTLEGVDVNTNGIRDDVELAIFEKYPDDIKARAGALQYAMALQLQLTEYVFNSDTLVAVIQLEEHGDFCLGDAGPQFNLSMPQTEITKIILAQNQRTKEIENLVFNTEQRKQQRQKIFEKYMTSYGGSEREDCDIDPVTLEK